MNARSNVTPIRATAEPVEPVYLSPEQVCELVPGLTVANLKDLRNRRHVPGLPVAYKPTGVRGHVTLYRRDEVLAWVESTRQVVGS